MAAGAVQHLARATLRIFRRAEREVRGGEIERRADMAGCVAYGLGIRLACTGDVACRAARIAESVPHRRMCGREIARSFEYRECGVRVFAGQQRAAEIAGHVDRFGCESPCVFEQVARLVRTIHAQQRDRMQAQRFDRIRPLASQPFGLARGEIGTIRVDEVRDALDRCARRGQAVHALGRRSGRYGAASHCRAGCEVRPCTRPILVTPAKAGIQPFRDACAISEFGSGWMAG